VARRGRHRRGARGGEVIQTARPRTASLIAGALAVTAEAALAVYPLERAGDLGWLVVATSALAIVLLLLSLVGLVGLVPWSVGLAAAGFVVVDSARSEPIVAAPVYGAGLLLVAELAYASRELARGAEEHHGRRVVRLAAVTAVALAAAALPAFATGVSPPSGIFASLLALGAAAVLLLPPILLLRPRH
jgi:hypothetical protein